MTRATDIRRMLDAADSAPYNGSSDSAFEDRLMVYLKRIKKDSVLLSANRHRETRSAVVRLPSLIRPAGKRRSLQ